MSDATLEVPEVEHSNLNPFDPTKDPAAEENRLTRAVDARRERLLAVRTPTGEPATDQQRRAQALYEEAGEQLRAARQYWREIGVAAGIRGPVSVVDNVVDRGELLAALQDIPEAHRNALTQRLGLADEEDKP